MLENYRLLVSVGHDEYWSKETRDNVEAFVTTGGNVAFFSANVCWFQVRFDLNVSSQICYKDARFDPFNPSQGPLVTVNWYDRPVCRAETSMTGVSYFGPENQAPLYQIRQPDHWVFEGLDLSSSTRFGQYQGADGVQTVVGYETDKYQPGSSDPCAPRSPQGLGRLAEVPGLDPLGNEDESKTTCTMGIVQKGKGQVFTAGTINWSLGLSQDDGWSAIDQITRNVFDRLA